MSTTTKILLTFLITAAIVVAVIIIYKQYQQTDTNDMNTAQINKLHPAVRQTFTDFIADATNTLGTKFRITSGLRTFDEQTALYSIGRTMPGTIVTNAKAGQSYHNYGLAVDLVALNADGSENWNYDMSQLPYDKFGLVWGGNFSTIHDTPHFQYQGSFKSSASDLLALVNSGDVDENGYVNLSGDQSNFTA